MYCNDCPVFIDARSIASSNISLEVHCHPIIYRFLRNGLNIIKKLIIVFDVIDPMFKYMMELHVEYRKVLDNIEKCLTRGDEAESMQNSQFVCVRKPDHHTTIEPDSGFDSQIPLQE